MLQIKKRTGEIVQFDRDKIITAINKAFLEVDGKLYKTSTAEDIARDIEKRLKKNDVVASIEQLQDWVEEYLMRSERQDVARAYVRFRYKKELFRQNNATYDSILKLVDLQNEQLKKENSNKNAVIASTQRDYMAGEVSKELTRTILLPTEVQKCHDNGAIHFHDADYFAQKIPNCCLVNLEDMLQNGTVINDTKIDKPHSFSTACTIATQIMAVIASGQYGGQSITLTHLAPFVDISRQKIRKEIEEDLDIIAYDNTSDTVINTLIEKRLKQEIKNGVQTMQYQINTLNTSNG